MKLWMMTQYEHCEYDTYDACVVAAETAEDAATIHPDGGDWPKPSAYGSWASVPGNVTVACIGEAAPGIERGVIIASFNAG